MQKHESDPRLCEIKKGDLVPKPATKRIMPEVLAAIKASNVLQRAARRKKKGPCMVATDFLRFLNQRTGWMGHDGCLVPPLYCHEWGGDGRTVFSRALQKVNDYLVRLGLRPDQPLSKEAESSVIHAWPRQFASLRHLAITYVGRKEKVLSKAEFRTSLNIMFRLIKERLPVVQELMPSCEASKLESQKYLGLVLDKKMNGLWGSCRQVN